MITQYLSSLFSCAPLPGPRDRGRGVGPEESTRKRRTSAGRATCAGRHWCRCAV